MMLNQYYEHHTFKTELLKESCTINLPPLQYTIAICVLPIHADKFVVFFSSRVWMLFDAGTQTKIKEGKTPFAVTEPFSIGDHKFIFFNKDDFQLYQVDLITNEITTPWANSWLETAKAMSFPSLLEKKINIGAFVKIMQSRETSQIVVLWQKGRSCFKSFEITDLLFLSCQLRGPTSIAILTNLARSLELNISNLTYSTILESTQKACMVIKDTRRGNRYGILLIDVTNPQVSSAITYVIEAPGSTILPMSLIAISDDTFALYRKNQNFGYTYRVKPGVDVLEPEQESYSLGFYPQTNFNSSFAPYKSEKHNIVVFDDSSTNLRSLRVCNKDSGKLIQAYDYPRQLTNTPSVLAGFAQNEGESFIVLKDITFDSSSNSYYNDGSKNQSSISFDWFHYVLTRRQRKLAVLFVLEHATVNLNGSKSFKFKDLFMSPIVAKDIYDCF